MTDERVKVAEITGGQAAELRARDANIAWLRYEVAQAQERLAGLQRAIAVSENERVIYASRIVRDLGLPEGPNYMVSAETGDVTAPVRRADPVAVTDAGEA